MISRVCWFVVCLVSVLDLCGVCYLGGLWFCVDFVFLVQADDFGI